MNPPLHGRSVIVTGSAQGIGAVLAVGLARMGARVLLADIIDTAAAVSHVKDSRGEAIGLRVDVTRFEDCVAMAQEALASFGRIDGLVCNAALFAKLPMLGFDAISEERWDRVMAVNVRGPWLCARACVPHMAANGGGSIVMMATTRVFNGYPMMLDYDASKGAVLAMGKSLAREVGPLNVRVNTIAPGLTMSEGVLARPGITERAAVSARSRALVGDQTPEDLVGAVGFFLSDASANITGQSLIVDGGDLMQ